MSDKKSEKVEKTEKADKIEKSEEKKIEKKEIKTSENKTLSDILRKEEMAYPFQNWDKEKNGDLIVKMVSIEKGNFNCVAYNRTTNKEEKMKLAITTQLKNQFEKFGVKEDLDNGLDVNLAIKYLGKKESNTTGNMYHNFVVKYFNRTLGVFQTTNQYLSFLQEEANK